MTNPPSPAAKTIPWATAVGRHDGTWLRIPAPDAGAAIRQAYRWREDGYRAVAVSCDCGTICGCNWTRHVAS